MTDMVVSSSWRRRRRSMTNCGRGRVLGTGRCSTVNGSWRSGIGASCLGFVLRAEGDAGADEERLGGVDGAVDDRGDLGNRQSVDVAQGEDQAVVGPEPLQRLGRVLGGDRRVPWVLGDRRVDG